MGTTTNYSLEYPAASDPPNGATQIQTLAEDVDTAVQTVEDAIPLVKAAQVSMTFDSGGHYTWTHGLAWTPDAVVATAEVGSTYASPVTVMVRSDSALATQVKFKAYTAISTPFTSTATVHVVAVKTA